MEETRNISSSSSFYEAEDLERLEHAPPFWRRPPGKKRLSKQLSMDLTPRDIAWLKRRRQMFQQERKKSEDLTDEDLNELKGSIELGFGFNEEDGQKLCHTLPALDLYFAVNRNYSTLSNSPTSSPSSRPTLSPSSRPTLSPSSRGSRGSSFDSSSSPRGFEDRSSSFDNLRSESVNDNSWMICSPGDDPQQVKMKLRHWAQAVACSVLQSH